MAAGGRCTARAGIGGERVPPTSVDKPLPAVRGGRGGQARPHGARERQSKTPTTPRGHRRLRYRGWRSISSRREALAVPGSGAQAREPVAHHRRRARCVRSLQSYHPVRGAARPMYVHYHGRAAVSSPSGQLRRRCSSPILGGARRTAPGRLPLPDSGPSQHTPRYPEQFVAFMDSRHGWGAGCSGQREVHRREDGGPMDERDAIERMKRGDIGGLEVLVRATRRRPSRSPS